MEDLESALTDSSLSTDLTTMDDDYFLNGTNVSSANTTVPPPINRFSSYEWHILFLCILLAVIVIGNSAVLAALFLAKTQRKTRMNFFIMHLALADLLVGLFNVLPDLVWRVTVAWYLGNAACKIVKYVQTVVLYSSNYVLVALSIDRYDAIRHPLKFSRSWRRARILIGVAWLLSFLFATPPLFIFYEKSVDDGTGEEVPQCWVDMAPGDNGGVSWHWKLYLTAIFLALFMIPAIIIAVCYTIMVHTIWTPVRILTPQTKNQPTTPATRFTTDAIQRRIMMCRNKSNGGSTEEPPRHTTSRGLIPKAKIKSVEMTFVIVFVFILCSSPYFVFSLLQVYDCIQVTQTTAALSTFFASLSPLNSAANPVIYCLFSTNICRNLRKLKFMNWVLARICPRWSEPSPISRHKFGQMHHQDVSQKTRTECTSLSDTFTRSANSIQSARHSSHHRSHHLQHHTPKRHIEAVIKDDIFKTEQNNSSSSVGENCVNNRSGNT